VFVGFPATEIKSEVNHEKKVKKALSSRDIDVAACNFFKSDADYTKYRVNGGTEAFWKYVYEREVGNCEDDAPDDLDSMTRSDEVYYGRKIARVEYGTVDLDLTKVNFTVAELIKKYPGVTVKAFLSHTE
jgi:hypothetical protein